jgi:uncharacterized SAM-binding protein YcdF (DUF218 family)
MTSLMSRTASHLRVPGSVVLVLGTGLLVIRGFLGRDAAEKIGTALLMPSGVLWILLMSVTIRFWPIRRCQSSGQRSWAAFFAFVLYSLAGNGFVADAMARALEGPYLQINPLNDPPVDQVIVLGGGGGLGANGRLQGNGSGDRMILAAQLYHAHNDTRFLCTGQRIESMNSSGVDPAETSRDVLMKLGVPDSSIEMVGGRNTSEEMQNLAKRFGTTSTRIGLLTSAWHMPRAMRLAKRNGLDPIPLPADFRTPPRIQPMTAGQCIEAIIPNVGALISTGSFAKEYLGMLVGR